MIFGSAIADIERLLSLMVGQQCSMNTLHAAAGCVNIHRTQMPAKAQSTKRRYEKRARAAQEEATRLRIIEATIALHATIGPARTTISAIAERAGVRRATVYRHFPDERALFLGCSGLFWERNAAPDPATWASIPDPAARLAAALDAVYGWYERVEPMLTAVLRDADAMPIVRELEAGRLAYLADVEDGLASGWGARGKAAKRLRATIGLALDFLAWRTLNERGLGRTDASAVISSAVRAAAASGRPTHSAPARGP
jgi:AcrR family transcriptional regulator